MTIVEVSTPPGGLELLCYTPEEFEEKREEMGIVRVAIKKGSSSSTGSARARAGNLKLKHHGIRLMRQPLVKLARPSAYAPREHRILKPWLFTVVVLGEKKILLPVSCPSCP